MLETTFREIVHNTTSSKLLINELECYYILSLQIERCFKCQLKEENVKRNKITNFKSFEIR